MPGMVPDDPSAIKSHGGSESTKAFTSQVTGAVIETGAARVGGEVGAGLKVDAGVEAAGLLS